MSFTSAWLVLRKEHRTMQCKCSRVNWVVQQKWVNLGHESPPLTVGIAPYPLHIKRGCGHEEQSVGTTSKSNCQHLPPRVQVEFSQHGPPETLLESRSLDQSRVFDMRIVAHRSNLSRSSSSISWLYPLCRLCQHKYINEQRNNPLNSQNRREATAAFPWGYKLQGSLGSNKGNDNVAEWLRRWIANPLFFEREGSNPSVVDIFNSWWECISVLFWSLCCCCASLWFLLLLFWFLSLWRFPFSWRAARRWIWLWMTWSVGDMRAGRASIFHNKEQNNRYAQCKRLVTPASYK